MVGHTERNPKINKETARLQQEIATQHSRETHHFRTLQRRMMRLRCEREYPEIGGI